MSYQPPGGPYYHPPVPTSGDATTSIILGIIGLIICAPICSPLAIVYGKRARREIAASGGQIGGESQATAGIVMGWIGIGFLALLLLAVAALVIIGLSTS